MIYFVKKNKIPCDVRQKRIGRKIETRTVDLNNNDTNNSMLGLAAEIAKLDIARNNCFSEDVGIPQIIE